MMFFLKSVTFSVFVLVFTIISLINPAVAQVNDQQLQNRIGQLEKQIQTMSRVVYRGEKIEPQYSPNYGQTSATDGLESSMANIEIRLSSIEKQLRLTTGQLERYEYENRELKKRLKSLESTLSNQIVKNTKQKPTATETTLYAIPKQTNPVTTPKLPSGGSLGTLTIPTTSSIQPTATTHVPTSKIAPPEQAYEQAYSHIRDGKYKKAAEEFKIFLDNYPNNKLSANAQYWLAETYYVRGKYSDAAKIFAKGYEKYPKSPKTADNLLKLGLSLSKIGKKEDACLTFSQLKKEYPNKTGIIMQRSLQEQKRLECNSM